MIRDTLADETKKKEQVGIQELLLKHKQNQYRSELVVVKEDQALVVNITVSYESYESKSVNHLANAVAKKSK